MVMHGSFFGSDGLSKEFEILHTEPTICVCSDAHELRLRFNRNSPGFKCHDCEGAGPVIYRTFELVPLAVGGGVVAVISEHFYDRGARLGT